MKFRKINEKTINCIITQDDLKKHGINLDDLFDRKKNAVEFIKAIILKAARSVNFNMKSEYTSMRLSVLPDQSVSLTISQDPFESDKIRREGDRLLSVEGNREEKTGAKHKRAAHKNTAETHSGAYLFKFSSLNEMAPCCRVLQSAPGISSAVYFDSNTDVYYLILEKGPDADENYDSYILRANEFGKMVTCSDRTLRFLREHSDCIIKSGALKKIAELFS